MEAYRREEMEYQEKLENERRAQTAAVSARHLDKSEYPIFGNVVMNCKSFCDKAVVQPPCVSCKDTDKSWREGYAQPRAVMYKTTSGDYGSNAPCSHTMPITFSSTDRKFTQHLGKCGMTRYRGLNNGKDQSPIPQHFPGHVYY